MVEAAEPRIMFSGLAPQTEYSSLAAIVHDDFVSIDSNTQVSVDVLANDIDPHGILDPSTLQISSGPANGSAFIESDGYGSVFVSYTPEVNFKGTDVLTYSIQEIHAGPAYQGTVTINVRNQPPVASDVVEQTLEDVPVTIDLLASAYDPDGLLDPQSLTITSQPSRGQVTLMTMNGNRVATYTPKPDSDAQLVVDEPTDINDGNFSLGHLSLREAIWLANADRYFDAYTYSVRDSDGSLSHEATVTIHVQPTPTVITFSPRLTRNAPRTISVSQVGDVSEGNSAFLINSTITIQGPAGSHGITLAGQGSQSDLRAFIVEAGGDLTLENLMLTRWASDSHGGTLFVEREGTATLTHCTVSNSLAVADGGAIFNNGALTLTDTTLSGNRAHYGGGLMNYGGATLIGSTLANNRAVDGAGINSGGDTGTGGKMTLTNCHLSGNKAEDRGGGFLIRRSEATLSHCIVNGNSAYEGGGLANFGSYLELDHSTITKNSATHGGGIFSAPGIIPEQVGGLNVSSVARLTTCTVTNNHARQGPDQHQVFGLSLTPYGGGTFGGSLGPAPAPEDAAIVTGPDGIRYALTRAKDLLRQFLGSSWTILDDRVLEYKIAPNGDIYWLNDRRELYRAQAGYAGTIIGGGVQSFAMDQSGTVYQINNLMGPGNFAAYRSLTAPLIDPVEEVSDGPLYCSDPPSGEEVMQALSLGGPDVHDFRAIVEPLADNLLDSQNFPNVGQARMHVCQYKCTFYYNTELNGESSGVIYIDRNHLVRSAASQNNVNAPVREAASQFATTTSVSIPYSPFSFDSGVRSLTVAADGTIYKLGGDYDGAHDYGLPPLPNVLWQLPPGGQWQPLSHVSQFAIDTDGTLYAINVDVVLDLDLEPIDAVATYKLQRLRPGLTEWTTLSTDVRQSFSLAPDGTLYALNESHELRRLSRGSTRWVTLDTGVQSISMAPDGTLYEINDRHQLKRLNGRGNLTILDVGVQSYSMADDGTLYFLNDRRQLKRLTGRSQWTVLDVGVLSFERGLDGTVYVLDNRHQLKQLTARDHWTVLDVGVQSFVVRPNAFQHVYVLGDDHQLKVLEAGYSWRTLQSGVVSLSIDNFNGTVLPYPAYGTVRVRDASGRLSLYGSEFTTAPVLDPVLDPPMFCIDPPTSHEIAMIGQFPIANSPYSNFDIYTEAIVDETDPAHIFPNIGPARLHHCHYRCTVTYDDSRVAGRQELTVYVDHDHLIRAPYAF